MSLTNRLTLISLALVLLLRTPTQSQRYRNNEDVTKTIPRAIVTDWPASVVP
jgi:hypothetical protein